MGGGRTQCACDRRGMRPPGRSNPDVKRQHSVGQANPRDNPHATPGVMRPVLVVLVVRQAGHGSTHAR